MQFTHEVTITVQSEARDAFSHWTDAAALPRHLTHIRAVAAGEADDLARFVIALDGRHIEFAAQRTMCTDHLVCWQSVGPSFLYVLTVGLKPIENGLTYLTMTVAYDPPGFLPDIAESMGRKKLFKQLLDEDLRRYAQLLQSGPAAVNQLSNPG